MLPWSGDSSEGRTRGQASSFTACCCLWLHQPGEGWLISLQMWLFAAEAVLEGAWAPWASKKVLIIPWDDDREWGRERKDVTRGSIGAHVSQGQWGCACSHETPSGVLPSALGVPI